MSEPEGTLCRGLPVADARGAATRGGVRAGDFIVRLNGREPLDVLDLEDAAADGALWMTVLRDGHPLDLVVTPATGEWHGISLGHEGLGDEPRTCINACRFCFVDQVPAGLRPALSVKDDDYRLSFLHGNFMTLSNLTSSDLERIEDLRLSPLYVSLHAWDDDARVRLMGRAAAGSRAALERLAAAGLELHLQVVLCPGWNDGEVLAETVRRAGELEAVADIGVVPVSLASEGELRRVTPADAEVAVAAIAGWQADFAVRRGRSFVHGADELYLLKGEEPPSSDAPEQYENGVGSAAALIADAHDVARVHDGRVGEADVVGPVAARPRSTATGVRLLSGALARPVVAHAAAILEPALGVAIRPFVVENRLFGPHVTVTGLLGGREVLDALRREPLASGEWLVAPRVFLPTDLGRTLDDVGEDELRAALDGRLVLAGSLPEAFATLSR